MLHLWHIIIFNYEFNEVVIPLLGAVLLWHTFYGMLIQMVALSQSHCADLVIKYLYILLESYDKLVNNMLVNFLAL